MVGPGMVPSAQRASDNKNPFFQYKNVVTRMHFVVSMITVFSMAVIAMVLNSYEGRYEKLFALFAFRQVLFGILGMMVLFFTRQYTVDKEGVRTAYFTRYRVIEMFVVVIITIVVEQLSIYYLKLEYRAAIAPELEGAYYVFAAFCEELFFRVFLMTLILLAFNTGKGSATISTVLLWLMMVGIGYWQEMWGKSFWIFGLNQAWTMMFVVVPLAIVGDIRFKQIGILVAIIFSSYWFAAVHLPAYYNNPVAMGVVFGNGIIWSAYYAIRHDVLPPMMSHAFKNFGAALLLQVKA